ncbi:unnamed protein product, partial [Effrenium voratum]
RRPRVLVPPLRRAASGQRAHHPRLSVLHGGPEPRPAFAGGCGAAERFAATLRAPAAGAAGGWPFEASAGPESAHPAGPGWPGVHATGGAAHCGHRLAAPVARREVFAELK